MQHDENSQLMSAVESYLYADLNRLPVSALSVRDAFSVIQRVVNHRLLVLGLLLQREDDASDVHVAVKKKIFQSCLLKDDVLHRPALS